MLLTEAFYIQIGLSITYYPAFLSSSIQLLTLSNLFYERACVLFNLASLYCQLASAQDRTSSEGINRALNQFQVCKPVEPLANPAYFRMPDLRRDTLVLDI